MPTLFFPSEYGILVHSDRMVQPDSFRKLEVEIFSYCVFVLTSCKYQVFLFGQMLCPRDGTRRQSPLACELTPLE